MIDPETKGSTKLNRRFSEAKRVQDDKNCMQ